MWVFNKKNCPPVKWCDHRISSHKIILAIFWNWRWANCNNLREFNTKNVAAAENCKKVIITNLFYGKKVNSIRPHIMSSCGWWGDNLYQFSLDYLKFNINDKTRNSDSYPHHGIDLLFQFHWINENHKWCMVLRT
jgi:hypothetical protein